jgi:hypothetical protein
LHPHNDFGEHVATSCFVDLTVTLCLFRCEIRFEGTTLKPIELIAFADFGAFLDQAPF